MVDKTESDVRVVSKNQQCFFVRLQLDLHVLELFTILNNLIFTSVLFAVFSSLGFS